MSVNLASTTREMWDATLEDEVILALPLVAMMVEHETLEVKGTKIKKTVVMDDSESLAQDYEANEPMTGGEKTVLGTAEWTYKKFQLPCIYDCDTEIENQDASKIEAPIDEVEATVEAAQDGARRHLNTLLYGAAADASKKTFQGLRSALTHDATYGGLARATTVTRPWWQSGSLDGTYTDQGTAVSASIANVRKAAIICGRHAKANQHLYAFCGETIFSKLKSQVEARMQYTVEGANLVKYGFKSFMIDNQIEIVMDSYLTITGATTDAYFFLLDPTSWRLRISPKRNFRMTPFKWQGEQLNGLDRYLARILVAGNFVCHAPNKNFFLSNMSN